MKGLRALLGCGVIGAIVLWSFPVLLSQTNPASVQPQNPSDTKPLRQTNANEIQTVFHFNGLLGAHPRAGLIQASDRNFYGTTYNGGQYDRGTLFRLSPEGQLSTLIHFSGPNGAHPLAELIQASDGNFYGTTTQGGQNHQGTLFRLTPTGEFTTLVQFGGRRGLYPSGALVEGANRILYGTTQKGGNFNRCVGGCGTIFQVSLNGALLTLLEFNRLNGETPLSGVTADPDGILWGTTTRGGESRMGVIFSLNPKGGFKNIVSFEVSNGAYPVGPLVRLQDKTSSAFYGVTQTGGENGQGTLFNLFPSGQLNSLVHFNGNNGANPDAGLMKGRDGLLYGTTINGGSSRAGVVYQYSAQGKLRVLRLFQRKNGVMPRGVLVEGQDGLLYGTTAAGGQYGMGTIFHLKSPFTKLTRAWPPSTKF
jgi:uncharacterized repeat protein (TIGR03803 family)